MMEAMTGMDSDERLWEARLVADVRAGVRLAENELYGKPPIQRPHYLSAS